MSISKKIIAWYTKVMEFFLVALKIFVKVAVLLLLVLLTIFLLASFLLPIVPKIYFLIYNYDFSYNRENIVKCENGKTCINNIKWNKDDLIISGAFELAGGYGIPDTILGFYKVEDDSVSLYIGVFDNQLGMLKLAKRADALSYDDKVNFKFTIKDLPKKNYKVILDNFEQWNFFVDGEKEILLKH